MPRIVRAEGVKLSEDVFKIRDTGPRRQPATKAEQETDAGFEEAPSAGGNAEEAYAGPVQGEIIQGAMAEASRILETAVKTAENSKGEILAQARFEADQMKKEALEQGRRQGFSSVIGEMREVANGLEEAIARFEGERAGYEVEYEDHLKWFAIEIASKVLARKVSNDDGELLEMVQKTVSGVQNEPWIRVEVAQEMSHLIARLCELYKDEEHIAVNAIAASPGTIHVETPSGLIDASLRTQLENLKEYFDKVKE